LGFSAVGSHRVEAPASDPLILWEPPTVLDGGDLTLHRALRLAHSDLCGDVASLRCSEDAISTAQERCEELQVRYRDLLRLYVDSMEHWFDRAFFGPWVGKLHAVGGRVSALDELDVDYSDWEGVSIEEPRSEASVGADVISGVVSMDVGSGFGSSSMVADL